ncbi:Cytochrome c oxidase subunit 5b-1, mitochondrial [Stylosanthes scabra]|uniref:Cytochrome c oxidase subunit 5b-1, mitochondrial n=1 Tax=Stylosanthes scabra TaxID=79078 RepID=A0ABU6R9S5_9FABA|nr:Cytochrome c oxidase subunit 5b-1, mitochondrial [Stylosanthes scabra]
MWRRILSSNLKSLISHSAPLSPPIPRSASAAARFATAATASRSSTLLSRHFSTQSDDGKAVKKTAQDVMPIATGHEAEEIEAELEGRDILEIDHPEGPFGTKEAPAVVKSYYDRRIVGCPGGEGEDEHDVVWFWLEKGKPHECPVCSQYFVLEVVGPGGDPYEHGHGHGHDEHHH